MSSAQMRFHKLLKAIPSFMDILRTCQHSLNAIGNHHCPTQMIWLSVFILTSQHMTTCPAKLHRTLVFCHISYIGPRNPPMHIPSAAEAATMLPIGFPVQTHHVLPVSVLFSVFPCQAQLRQRMGHCHILPDVPNHAHLQTGRNIPNRKQKKEWKRLSVVPS